MTILYTSNIADRYNTECQLEHNFLRAGQEATVVHWKVQLNYYPSIGSMKNLILNLIFIYSNTEVSIKHQITIKTAVDVYSDLNLILPKVIFHCPV